MSITAKIYEGVEGLIIDCKLYDSDGTELASEMILQAKLIVVRPGATIEEDWTVSIETPNILRHIIPEGADIMPGTYKIQPYIETADGFKGRWGTVKMVVTRKMG